MALKTKELPEVPAEAPAPAAKPATTVLELALYTIYTWGGRSYHKGQPYRFKNEDAMQLLAEQDTGRPIWKLYRPVRKVEVKRDEIIDATGATAIQPTDEPISGNIPEDKKAKRIDIGTDDEIADILNRPPEDESDNVTV